MPITATVAVPASATHQADLERLQGAWDTVAGRREAKLLIAGQHYTFEFRDGAIYMGKFSLDCAADPRCMDMHIDEGPDGHKGQVALCIYRVESDVLHWCPAKPGAGRRPGTFPSLDDEFYLSLVFKRAKPRKVH